MDFWLSRITSESKTPPLYSISWMPLIVSLSQSFSEKTKPSTIGEEISSSSSVNSRSTSPRWP